MNKNSKIYIAGHTGLVGSALVRRFEKEGFSNLILCRHSELDLERQPEVEEFFEKERPEYVFLAAAKVGGIHANNTYPAEFIYRNLAIQNNVIHSAWKVNVKRLIFLGSSCIYPRDCPQPMKEEHLLSGPLEATNEPYAVAKIAGIKMCQSYNRQYGTKYLAVMPTNLYGPNDNFDLENSHVLAALIRKFHLAGLFAEGRHHEIKKDESLFGPVHREFFDRSGDEFRVKVWGSGNPCREFLHADDLAGACLFLMKLDDTAFSSYTDSDKVPLINIGCGKEITIKDLAHLIKDAVGFKGGIIFDSARPDGTHRKLLDITRIRSLGWEPVISLQDGIVKTYSYYLAKTNNGYGV